MAQFRKSEYVKAIEMKCKECVYDPIGGKGSWREQVKNCQGTSCPLYAARPLPTGEKHAESPRTPHLDEDKQLEFTEL
jgi:hypothetical protein